MSSSPTTKQRFTGDSRDNITDDPRVKEVLSQQASKENKKDQERFHQAMHTRLLATSLPRQRVHDHATLYLAADALGHWKEVAAATAEHRVRALRQKQQEELQRQQQKYQHQRRDNHSSDVLLPSTSSITNISSAASVSMTRSNSPSNTMTMRRKKNLNNKRNFNQQEEDDEEEHKTNSTDKINNNNSNITNNNNNNNPDSKQYDGDVVVTAHHPPPGSSSSSAGMLLSSSGNLGGIHHHPSSGNSSLSIVDASRPSERVLVINVGGTLGMHPSEKDGRLRPKAGFLLEQMLNLHELRFPEVPVFDFIEYHDLVDSSDLNSMTWETLARDIAEHYDDYSGILVAHGTDTLHYTAAALSFALERLAKPVIVMGSMIPLCELYTDTRRNVTAALRFAGCGSWLQPGVYVFFHEQLFYGTRCVKMNDSLKAFDSPNSAPAADLNTLRFIRSASATMLGGGATQGSSSSSSNSNNAMLADRNSDRDHVFSDSFYQALAATSHVSAPLNLRAKFSDRVLCLGIVPDTVLSEASKLFTAKNNSKYRNNITLPRAIILKVPEMNIKGSVRLAASLQSFGAAAAASGCAVFATSSSSLHGLSPSTIATLLRYVPDVVPLNDMLCETACVKAMWLLGEMLFSSRGGGGHHQGGGGNYYYGGGGGHYGGGGGSYGGNFSDHNGMENFKRLMFVNLRGEVTETAKSIPRPVWMSRL